MLGLCGNQKNEAAKTEKSRNNKKESLKSRNYCIWLFPVALVSQRVRNCSIFECTLNKVQTEHFWLVGKR